MYDQPCAPNAALNGTALWTCLFSFSVFTRRCLKLQRREQRSHLSIIDGNDWICGWLIRRAFIPFFVFFFFATRHSSTTKFRHYITNALRNPHLLFYTFAVRETRGNLRAPLKADLENCYRSYANPAFVFFFNLFYSALIHASFGIGCVAESAEITALGNLRDREG